MLYSIVQWTGGTLSPILQAAIIGLALLYAGLVISHPMALPAKEPAPLTRFAIRETAKPIAAAVIGGTLIMAALSAVVGTTSDSTRSSTLGMLAALLLALIVGTLGAAAERTLPVDLFPILRRREVRHPCAVRLLFSAAAAWTTCGAKRGSASAARQASRRRTSNRPPMCFALTSRW
jgi:hypothetical protein